MRKQRPQDRHTFRMVSKWVGLAAVVALFLACQPAGEDQQENARQPAIDELLDSTYLKNIPLGDGFSCHMYEFAENHGAIGYRGMLKNESSNSYLSVILAVSGYDASGHLLATMNLAVAPVRANDTTRFVGILSADYWKFAKYWVRLKKLVPKDEG